MKTESGLYLAYGLQFAHLAQDSATVCTKVLWQKGRGKGEAPRQEGSVTAGAHREGGSEM